MRGVDAVLNHPSENGLQVFAAAALAHQNRHARAQLGQGVGIGHTLVVGLDPGCGIGLQHILRCCGKMAVEYLAAE